MRRPNKIRRFFKWATLLSGLFLLAAWGLNHRWYLDVAGLGFFLQFRDGHTLVNWDRSFVGRISGITLNDAYGPTLTYHSDMFYRASMMLTGSSGWTIEIELWMLAAFFLIIATGLWLRDRGYPRGCCPMCGYNLAGNISGSCPECGDTSGCGGRVVRQ